MALLALLPPAGASANIVNVQTRFSEVPEDGLAGSFDFSADWRTGNQSLLVLGTQGSVQYGAAAHQIMLSARAEITPADSIREGRRTFEHLRYRYWFTPRWAAESFVQHEYVPTQRIRLRLIAGLGPRWVILHSEHGALAVGVAAMPERVETSRDGEADAGDTENVLRVSSYLMGRLAISEVLTLSQAIYMQPRVRAPDDYRLLSETGLDVPLTDTLSLNVSLIASRRSRPPEGVVPFDARLLNRLIVRF